MRAAAGKLQVAVDAYVDADSVDFDEFVRNHVAALLRTAYLLTGGDGPAAEDAVQETLTRLYPRWAKVQHADNPVAYVRRSLINTYLNGLRSAPAHELVVRAVEERSVDSDLAQAAVDRDQIRRLIRHLPERQRAALVLRYFDDLSDREVGRALGSRPGTARSLISRGLATVRAELARSQGGDSDA